MTSSSTDSGTEPVGAPPRRQLTVRHLFILVPIAALGWRAVTPLGDNSFLWHVRAGTLQLDLGEVLRSDPFSFTAGGEPWRTQSWLIELGYGWLERTAGSLQWVPTMMFVILAATLAFVGLAVYFVMRDPLRTALLVTLVATVGMMFVVPRPVIVSFLLLAVFVVVLQHPERLGWILVPLAWMWAALHGLFVVGVGLVFLEAIRRRSRRLLGMAVAAGAATLLTARGLGILGILLKFFENREALGYLSEWARPDFTNPLLAPFVLVVVGVGFALWKRRLGWDHLVVGLPFVLLGVAQLRSVFPALLVLAPLGAAAIPVQTATAPRSGGSRVVNQALAATIVLLGVLGLARPIGLDEDVLPPETARAALSEDEVFHGPGAGGLLIWAEYPGRRVFVDDRAELYGASMFEELVATIRGSAGTAMLDRHGLDEALVKTSWELDGTLLEAGWEERYRDDNWAVYARP